MSDDEHEVMTSILDWFGQIEEWVPGAGKWAADLLVGPIPLAYANNAYDLADHWGRLADALNAAYEDVMQAANPILENWSGDGAAQVFVEQWFAYLEGLRQTADSAAQMQRGAQNFGLEVELMKFMAALNLIMLAVSLFMLIAAAIPTGGGSLGAAPGLFATCRIALGRAASQTVGKIASIVMRIVMRVLTRLFGRISVAIAQRVAQSALPRIAAVIAERLATAMTKTFLGRLARAIAARGISKAVANRLAAQALRELADKEIEGTLTRQATREAQHLLAKEIRNQLLRKWAGKEGQQVAESALEKLAAKQIENSLLGREFAKYVGTRIAFGAGFMGGGNLLGQFGQVLSGNRAAGDVDWAQVKDGAFQGAVFGAGMFGGVVGHTVGGALAGGGLTLGQEIYNYVDSGHKDAIDWTAVGHSAVQGGAAGVLFGGQASLEHANLSLPHTRLGSLRIGADVHLLPGDHDGFNVVATRANGREGLLLTSDGYVAFQGRDGVQHIPAEIADRPDVAAIVDQHFAGLTVDPRPTAEMAPSPGDVRVDAPPARTDASAGAPTRSSGGGGDDGGGGGGGGPRQNVPGTSGPRTTETGRSSEASSREGAPLGGPQTEHPLVPDGTGDHATVDGAAAAASHDGPAASHDGPAVSHDGPSPDGGDRPPGDGTAVRDGAGPGADRIPVGGDRTPAHQAAGQHAPAEHGRSEGGSSGARQEARGGGRRSDDVASPVGPSEGLPRTGADRAGSHLDARTGEAGPPAGEHAVARTGHDAPARHDGGDTVREPGESGPPGGPPHDPTGVHPHAAEHHGDEPVMRSAGAEVGVWLPTSESIGHGTVRMELHPNYPKVVAYLSGHGFRLVEDPAGPRAVIRHLYSADGKTFLGEEREVRHLDGMRYLDLEHELDHVRQLIDRFHGDLGTEAYRVRENGTRVEMQGAQRILSAKYDTVVEYHVRLGEAIRLIRNGVDPALIREHLAGVDERRALMNQKIHQRDSKAQAWRREHFSDIPALERELGELREGFSARESIREVDPYRLVTVDGPAPERPLAAAHEVKAVLDGELSGLVEGRDAGAADQPYRADWDPESGTFRVHYGDGLEVDVVVQVNESVPPGHTVVVRPTMETVEGGGWRQAGPAGVVLSSHVPGEAAAREPHVLDALHKAWHALHTEVGDQLHPPDAFTGASIRPRDELRAYDWSDRAYERFRSDDADVAEIAGNIADIPRTEGGTPFTQAEIHQIKQHLMVKSHPIRDYEGNIEMRRFDSSPDIAEAWIRLREGRPLPEDLVLLNHELTESTYMLQHPEAEYRTAHDVANEQHNWQDNIPERTGEDLDNKWGRHDDDGNSGRLPENPGDRHTGGVSLRKSGDGPPADNREIHTGGFSGRRYGGSDVRGGVHEDPPASAGTGELAGGRNVRGVEPDALRALEDPVPEVPVRSEDAVGRHQAAPAEPPEPGLLTPESVRQSIAGRGGPEQLGRWAGEHLADRAENGTLRPKTAEEIAATVDRLADQAVDLVRPESHRSEDLYSRTGHRTNQDVFDNGGEAPQTMEAVHHVADILGLDLGGVEIRLIDEPSEIRYMDHMGASAVTRRDGEHLEVALGPASFASAESLAVNLAHEHRHVEQHRSGASVDTASLRGLEEDAYGVEGAALERFRARFEGWDSAGEVPGRGGVRPAEEGIDPGGRTGGGRSGVGGDDASSRGDRSHDQDSGHRSDTTAGRQPRPGELDHRSGQRDAADAGDDPGRSVAASRSGAGDEVRHTASPIGGSDFVPDGRAWHEPDVSVAELHRAAQGALPADFADGRVSYVTSDGPHVRVEMTDGSVRHFLPRVGEGMRDLAETTVRSGTPEDPHIVDVNRRVAGEQLTRVWVHEITETLALQHAAESRPEPHGLVRRAMAAVGRIFGRGDTPQPEAARIDPHVAARINERLHLQRLHDWSWARPDEQIRLQREIAGVDRDLAALGHGVDPPRLEWRSSDWGVPHEIVQDGVIRGAHHAIPAHEPARHEPAPPESSFDRHWTDKPWEREGRRPSLDELIPLTDAEAAHWGGEVKAEVARQIESREFGEGFRVRFDEDRGHPISVDRNSVTLRFKVYGPDGSLAGHTIRGFSRENDGTLYVTHSSIKLYDEAQGRGFSDGWNSFLEDWYHESGVNHIEVHAVDRGAYAWARAGYDWAPNTEHRANGVLKNLRSAVGRIDEHLDQLDRWRRGEVEPDIASLLERYGAVHPDQLPDRMRYERDAGQQILDRAARHPFGSEGYPTPNEISRAGADGRHGRDQVWVGKEALLGSDWKGVKPISDGGVAHPHPRTDAPGGLTRPLELVPHSGPRGPGEPRTPLRDLFPPTEEQAAHWRPVVERALIRELEGRDFAGLEVRVDSVSAEPGHIVAHLSVLRPDHPEPVGRITRQFVVDRTGEMEALHTTLALDRGFQGKGFARAFNDHMEGWYAESGVDRVSLEAASSVGGYAWARDGYGWDPRYGAGEAHGAFRRLQSELGNLWADIERLDQADAAGDSRTVDQIVRRYGFSDFETAWDRMTEQAREADTLLEKYHASGLGRPTFPSPNDISQAGRAGEAGHTASWIGKRAMMGSSWHGSRVPEPRPEAPLRAEPEPHHHDAPQHDHELHDQDLHDAHRWPARTNYDVLVNGSDVPLHEAAVAHVAELLGIDLSGVRVHLITDSAEALHYDAWGVSAVTPPEKGGREIRLGPAAFADAETLAATVAHEYTHVVQLREGRELGTHTMRALEDEAFASEGPALDRFRQGFEGWERVREGAVLDRGGPRPEEPGRPAGFGEGSRGSDLHRGDAAGRGDWSYGESAGSGVRDAGGPFAGTDHVGGGAHESHPDSRRPDPRDLNRPIGGRRSDGPPFGYDRYYRDPRWTSEAVAFEMRLGVHYFNDPHTLNTAREAVSHLRDVLTRLATSGVDDPVARAAIAREVETAFFRGDEKSFNSAGQVGLGVPLDAVLREGNLRELMTAFYNAAYFNRDSPHTLAATLLDVIDRGRWDEAARAGIDVAELYDMRDQLDHSLNRAIFGRIEEIRPPSESPRFVRDVFATGNVIMRSPRGFRNMLEVVASQLGRRARDEVEQLALATTVGHYEQLGAPLGKFERAFVESILGGSLEPGTKLPWREGVVSHDTGGSIWARGVGRDGYPVLDGVSATTTRMLTGVKMIGIHGPEATHFLHALMGWMLPARDHSIFELLRGGSMAGVEPLAVHPRSARPTAIDLYRNLPGVDPHTLRTEVAEGGLFPHEARYLDHALDPNGFAETQHRVQEIADRLRPQLESGRVTDADLAHWLERNGIDPHDPVAVRDFAEHLTRPHMISMAVYSLYSHQLINTVITAHMMTREVSESAVRLVHDRAIANLVDPYLHKLAEGKTPSQLPFGLRSVLHEGDGLLDSTSPLRPSAQRWVEAIQARHAAREEAQRFLGAGDDVSARRAKVEADRAGSDAAAARRQIAGELGEVAPKLFDEVRWHADMVYDALMQLPTVGTPQEPVVAYRGAAANLASTVTYGNRILPGGKAVSVLSLSRDLEVAVGFMTRNSASDDKVLAVYRLIGVNARDISVFSAFPRQQEIVLPPRARTIRVSDPILEQQVRDQLPPEWRDHCRIIVLEERG